MISKGFVTKALFYFISFHFICPKGGVNGFSSRYLVIESWLFGRL